MFEFKNKLKKEKILKQYFTDLDDRITSYMEVFLHKVSEQLKEEIVSKLKKIDEEEAEVMAKLLEAVLVDKEVVPKPERKTKNKKTNPKTEEHYGGVFAEAPRVPAGAIEKNTHVITFKKKNKGELSTSSFVLLRFSPWTFDTIPLVPDEKDLITIFKKVDMKQVEKVRRKNEVTEPNWKSILSKSNIKVTSREKIDEELNGYQDLQFWSIKKEFGVDGDLKAVWRPSIKKLTSKEYGKILKQDKLLSDILFNPNFKNYKNLGKKYKMIDENDVKEIIDFQNKIKG